MASPVREVLEAYVAGRVKADRVVAAVMTEYYGKREAGNGKRWQPVLDVIERAAPGVVELSGSAERPGYEVRLTARPFPKDYEPQLRAAVETALGPDASGAVETTFPVSRFPFPGFWSLLRRLFASR